MKHKIKALPLLIVMMVFMAVFLSACNGNAESSSETAWEPDPNIEIVRDFFIYDDYDGKGYKIADHYYLVKNHYDKDINIGFNTTVYNEKHREIESAKGQNICIGAGQYGVVQEMYYDKKLSSMTDYDYTYKVSDVYRGMYSETANLKSEYIINDKNTIIISATNNSENNVLARLSIILLKDGEPVNCRTITTTNDNINTRLLSGTTDYKSLYFDIDYDDVELYPEAYVSSTIVPQKEIFIGEKAFDYIEIKEEYFADDFYCYILHNKSDRTLNVCANGFFKDEDGELIDVYNCNGEYIGAGEDICFVSLTHNVDEDIKPETMFVVAELSKNLDLSNIEVSYKIDTSSLPRVCYITTKNNGSENINYLKANVVFLKDGKPVYWNYLYIDVEDYILYAGQISENNKLFAYKDFDDVKIYLSANPM